ncbi:MAG: GGDEF domain-containing response regulator [Desulfovibrio sp.]|nr:GGDEF domain-containing response regulator [Desulfovibrio sp.]
MTQHCLRSLTVLLVEDDNTARQGLALALEAKVSRVFQADNGDSGFSQYASIRPDIIITDIRMPRMDGLAMVRAIRDSGGDPFIIIASGAGEEQAFLEAIELGVNLFIKKPYNAEDIFTGLERAAAEIARRRHDTYRRALSDGLLAHVPNCHLLSDGAAVLYFNDPQAILQYPAHEGQELGPYLRENFTVSMRQGVEQSSLPLNMDAWLTKHSGSEFVLAGNGQSRNGHPVRYLLRLDRVRIHSQERHLLTFTDISLIESERERFYQLAGRDYLTGVGNRQAFETELAREIERSKRYGSDLSLVMLDIDDFKSVNDTLGHQTGDAVLVALARCMAAEVRVTDIICRFGGEEFMVIMPQSELEGALSCAGKLGHSIAEYDFGIGRRITVSLGVAQYQPGESSHTLVRRVDTALYEAKGTGKNRVVTALDAPFSCSDNEEAGPSSR